MSLNPLQRLRFGSKPVIDSVDYEFSAEDRELLQKLTACNITSVEWNKRRVYGDCEPSQNKMTIIHGDGTKTVDPTANQSDSEFSEAARNFAKKFRYGRGLCIFKAGECKFHSNYARELKKLEPQVIIDAYIRPAMEYAIEVERFLEVRTHRWKKSKAR